MSYYKRKVKNKSEGQTIHALNNAHKRYGVNFKEDDLARIRKIIQGGESVSCRKLTNSRIQHRVIYQGRTFDVVYDKTRKQICTFLPLED